MCEKAQNTKKSFVTGNTRPVKLNIILFLVTLHLRLLAYWSDSKRWSQNTADHQSVSQNKSSRPLRSEVEFPKLLFAFSAVFCLAACSVFSTKACFPVVINNHTCVLRCEYWVCGWTKERRGEGAEKRPGVRAELKGKESSSLYMLSVRQSCTVSVELCHLINASASHVFRPVSPVVSQQCPAYISEYCPWWKQKKALPLRYSNHRLHMGTLVEIAGL